MANFVSGDQLVQALAADLTPVRRVASPLMRALVWLAVMIAIAAGLAAIQDLRPPLQRLRGRSICVRVPLDPC